MYIDLICDEPEVEWNCPEGCFSGKLIAIKPVLDPDQLTKQVFKFIFEVQVPEMPDKSVRAIKKLTYSNGSKSMFRKTLVDWLGKEYVSMLGTRFNTDVLLNKPADLVTRHIHNDGYDNPFVVIDAIRPVDSINKGTGI
jgi:hypothetical protein